MATYLISYDLVGSKEEDYPQLIAALRAAGGVRILYSEWLVKSIQDSGALANHFLQHMDTNDRIFVCTAHDWAFHNIMNEEAAKKLLPGS